MLFLLPIMLCSNALPAFFSLQTLYQLAPGRVGALQLVPLCQQCSGIQVLPY